MPQTSYRLAAADLAAIGDHLNAQVADLVAPALCPALLIGVEGRDGAIHLVGEGTALVCHRLPLLTLERAAAHPVDLAWARWVLLVCARLRVVAGRSPAVPTPEDEGAWALDWLIQLDPGLPWFEDALQDTLDQATQAGERMLASYPFAAGGARSILDALTNAATAMALILAAPSYEVEHGTH